MTEWNVSSSAGKARACTIGGAAQEKVESAGEGRAEEGYRGGPLSAQDAK